MSFAVYRSVLVHACVCERVRVFISPHKVVFEPIVFCTTLIYILVSHCLRFIDYVNVFWMPFSRINSLSLSSASPRCCCLYSLNFTYSELSALLEFLINFAEENGKSHVHFRFVLFRAIPFRSCFSIVQFSNWVSAHKKKTWNNCIYCAPLKAFCIYCIVQHTRINKRRTADPI